jgi:Glycosyl transferase family 2
MTAPRFSVILPTVDRSSAIRPTIDSVLAQTEHDWELIVVSDASTDDTDEIVRGYADRRIALERLPRRAGHPGPPRNAGLALARGELVAYLDHDDRWRPDHLALLGALLERGSGARLASTGSTPIDAAGRALGAPTSYLDAVWSPELQVMNPMFEPSRVAHRRGVAERAGGWGSGPVGLEDWDLWLRLADGGERFATSSRPTAMVLHDPGTRRHAVPVRHQLVLGRAPSLDHALHALALLALAPMRARVRELHVQAAARWYAQAHREGALVLPGAGPPRPWAALWDAALPEDPLSTSVGARPVGDGAVVCRPLACTGAEHARRIERISEERLAPMHAFVRRVVDAAARLAEDQLRTCP